MNREEIKKIIPHREPMLLVDNAEIDENETARGEYSVKGDEFFLNGHFPGNPVVPGVILCEILAQSCAVLLADKAAGATPYFTSLNNVKFRKMVKPGDTIKTECTITKVRLPFYFAQGKGFVDGKLCVSAEFSFAVIKDGSNSG